MICKRHPLHPALLTAVAQLAASEATAACSDDEGTPLGCADKLQQL